MKYLTTPLHENRFTDDTSALGPRLGFCVRSDCEGNCLQISYHFGQTPWLPNFFMFSRPGRWFDLDLHVRWQALRFHVTPF